MNDDVLDAIQALKTMKADARMERLPILAFANHEEIETWNRRTARLDQIVSRNEFSSRTRIDRRAPGRKASAVGTELKPTADRFRTEDI